MMLLYRYCDHMLSPEIDNCVVDLLSDLHRFQTRAYLKDPIKVVVLNSMPRIIHSRNPTGTGKTSLCVGTT